MRKARPDPHSSKPLTHSLTSCDQDKSQSCPLTFSGRRGRGWRSPPQSPSPRPPPSCLLLTEFHRVERVEGGETRQVRTTRRCCWAATSFELGLISPELRHRLIYGFLSVPSSNDHKHFDKGILIHMNLAALPELVVSSEIISFCN